MKSLKEISAKAKEYAPDREDLQDAFVNGARYVITGKYYIQADVFSPAPSILSAPLSMSGGTPTTRNADGRKRKPDGTGFLLSTR